MDHAVEDAGRRPGILCSEAVRRPRLGVGLEKRGIRSRAGCPGGIDRPVPDDERRVVFRPGAGKIGHLLLPAFAHDAEHRVRGEGGRAEPALDHRAAPGAVHNAHRHVQPAKNVPREEVADGREAGRGLGRTWRPGAVGGLGRRRRELAGDLELADQRETGGRHLLFGILHPEGRVARVVEDEFHVRLSRAKPHLAHDDIMEDQRLAARDGEILPGRIGGKRSEPDDPAAIPVRCRGDRLPVKSDTDGFARRGPAPDRRRLVALQHRMIGEKRREAHGGPGRRQDAGR